MSTRLTENRGFDAVAITVIEVAVFGRADLPLGFLPGLAGRDEHDLVEAELVRDLAGRDEVTVMDRVEGAAHDADPRSAVQAGPISSCIAAA